MQVGCYHNEFRQKTLNRKEWRGVPAAQTTVVCGKDVLNFLEADLHSFLNTALTLSFDAQICIG